MISHVVRTLLGGDENELARMIAQIYKKLGIKDAVSCTVRHEALSEAVMASSGEVLDSSIELEVEVPSTAPAMDNLAVLLPALARKFADEYKVFAAASIVDLPHAKLVSYGCAPGGKAFELGSN